MECDHSLSLPRGMMVVADHPCDFPRSVLVLPEMDELAFADAFGILVPGMMKLMHARLQQAVSLPVEDLQGAGNQLARLLSGDIFSGGGGEGCPAERHSTLIVVELDIIHEERLELR